MSFTASVSTTTPLVLTVTSDFRAITGTVTAASNGQTATTTYNLIWPLTISDSTGHQWKVRSDNGATAIYDY